MSGNPNAHGNFDTEEERLALGLASIDTGEVLGFGFVEGLDEALDEGTADGETLGLVEGLSLGWVLGLVEGLDEGLDEGLAVLGLAVGLLARHAAASPPPTEK